jgi:hypothetical protein
MGWGRGFTRPQLAIDARLTRHAQDGHMGTASAHRVQLAVDCECGTTAEACDDDELLDELLEHIAAVHEAGMAREPAALLTDSYEA